MALQPRGSEKKEQQIKLNKAIIQWQTQPLKKIKMRRSIFFKVKAKVGVKVHIRLPIYLQGSLPTKNVKGNRIYIRGTHMLTYAHVLSNVLLIWALVRNCFRKFKTVGPKED